MVSAEPLELVAWRRGRQGFTKYHVARVAAPGELFCPATIPAGVRICRIPFNSIAGDICTTCVKHLNVISATALKLEG